MAYKESISIIADTREQKPILFGRYKDVFVTRGCLKQGDYRAVLHTKYGNLISRTIYDRKSKGDLWGTFAGNHDRFKREFNRSIAAKEKLCVIVEESSKDIRAGFTYTGKRHPVSGTVMKKKLETFREKYGLELIYCDGRADMQGYMVDRWMAQVRLCNKLLAEFGKTGNFELLEALNRKVFLWA